MDRSPTPQSQRVRSAYGSRAREYAELFGAADRIAPEDRALVERWARGVDGGVLDVGCGPGQWTRLLGELGVAATGIDPVPEFIELARAAFPECRFQAGTAEATGFGDAEFGGVLAWYSLIHTEPDRVGDALAEFRRILAPEGQLALGFFEGPRLEAFDHAVVTAYFWPLERMIRELDAAGFDTSHTETRTGQGSRAHAAVTAVRR